MDGNRVSPEIPKSLSCPETIEAEAVRARGRASVEFLFHRPGRNLAQGRKVQPQERAVEMDALGGPPDGVPEAEALPRAAKRLMAPGLHSAKERCHGPSDRDIAWLLLHI